MKNQKKGCILMFIGVLLFLYNFWISFECLSGGSCLLKTTWLWFIIRWVSGFILFILGFLIKESRNWKKATLKLTLYLLGFIILLLGIYLPPAIKEVINNTHYFELFRFSILVSSFLIIMFFYDIQKNINKEINS